MLRNYLTIALRNLARNKVFSFINLFGLAVGIASSLFIGLFVHDELQYDRFLPQVTNVYEVNIDGNFGGQELRGGFTPPPVGKTMQREFPEVKSFTRVFHPDDVVVKSASSPGKLFSESRTLAVDSNFLQVFQYPLVAGNAAACLQEPTGVVITENMARKYFGKGEALNQPLLINDQPHRVTAVLRNLPSQSSFQFDFLLPIRIYPVVNKFDWSWVWLNVQTFVVLQDAVARDPARVAQLEAKFPAMVRKHAPNAFARIGQPYDAFIKKGGKWDFLLQPFTDVHLRASAQASRFTNLGSAQQVYTFGVVALMILLLACVNFMNLATAQSAKRAKEVGVRKVLGSFRRELIGQFLTESLLYSLLATALAMALVALLLPAFNQLSGKTIAFESLLAGGNWLYLLGLAALVGLLAGSYPAFYLTAFKPATVLKARAGGSGGGTAWVRNGLVVFQFVVSIALIVSTIVVFSQLRYSQTKDLGLDKENVLVLPNYNRLATGQESFRQEVLRLAGVADASISTSIPLRGGFGDFYVPEPTRTDRQVAKDLSLFSFMTDPYFVPTLGIQVVQGRNFSRDFNDSASVILNETAVKQIGWKNPLGRTLTYPGGDGQRFRVVGVVKDFDLESVRAPMSAFALFHHASKSYQTPQSYLLVRLRAGNPAGTLAKIERQWRATLPGAPFDYSFLDSAFANAYRTEQQTGQVFGVFAGLAIVIACLGLFGLAAFIAEQRTKEIGIRKVLGASVGSVVALLSKDFLKLVLVAFVIAVPIAWYAMNRWLQDFAYRIDVSWWIFALAGGLALLIALLTVSYQAIRAALANPVKSLRTE